MPSIRERFQASESLNANTQCNGVYDFAGFLKPPESVTNMVLDSGCYNFQHHPLTMPSAGSSGAHDRIVLHRSRSVTGYQGTVSSG